MGSRSEVLAWNPAGHALLAGHCDFTAPMRPTERPNLTRMLFLDPHTRELYASWKDEAIRAVASLRLLAGRLRDDRELVELVGDLILERDDFARLWSKHPVRNCTSGVKQFHHPEAGNFELEFQVLRLPDDSAQRVLTYTALPDTASQAALHLLVTHSAASREPRRTTRDRTP